MMAEQPQPAAARAFVEAERNRIDHLRALHRECGATVPHADYSRLLLRHAQALDLIQQQADEIDRLRARVGELEGEVLRKTAEIQEAYEGQQF